MIWCQRRKNENPRAIGTRQPQTAWPHAWRDIDTDAPQSAPRGNDPSMALKPAAGMERSRQDPPLAGRLLASPVWTGSGARGLGRPASPSHTVQRIDEPRLTRRWMGGAAKGRVEGRTDFDVIWFGLVWFGFDFDFAASCCRNRKWGTLIRPPGDAESAMRPRCCGCD
jgi:hypothetical protein